MESYVIMCQNCYSNHKQTIYLVQFRSLSLDKASKVRQSQICSTLLITLLMEAMRSQSARQNRQKFPLYFPKRTKNSNWKVNRQVAGFLTGIQ